MADETATSETTGNSSPAAPASPQASASPQVPQSGSEMLTGGAQTQTGAAAAHWLDGAEPELKGFAETKGWKDKPLEALRGYTQLEKMLGSDKIPVPKSGDEAGFDQAMSKLGWPREASGYSYEPPNDIELKGVIQGEKLSDDPLFQLAHKALHEGRATGEQYKRVMNALVKGVADFTAASRGERTKELEAYKAERQAEVNDLRKEWGGKFDENMAVAKRAALAFGFTPEQFEAIEAVAGAKTLLSGFHNMGRRIGEIGSDLGGQGGSFGPASPEAALAELSRLESDKEFRAAFYDRTHAGHKEAVAKHNQLSALAYPSRTSVVPHAGQQR